MSVTTATTIMVGSFLIYLILRSINFYLGAFYLLILFIFAYIITDKQFSAFYMLLFIIALIIDLAIKGFSVVPANQTSLLGMNFKGFTMIIAMLIFGLALYVLINVISARVGGNIVGAPTLQVTTNQIAQNLRPTFVSHLGIIENYFAFVSFELLNFFGVMIPLVGVAFNLVPYILPVILVGLLMGIFHVAAYSVAFSLLLWASFAFMMFIISYIITKDSLPADFAHFLNNGIIDIARPLALVI